MTTAVTTSVSIPGSSTRNYRNFSFVLYESNLFDDALHPDTGLATPGIHTKVLGLTDARSRSVSFKLNRPGSANFMIPLISRQALEIVGYEVKRCIVVFADNGFGQTIIWSGYISAVVLNSASASIQVTCTGWLQMFYGREFRQQMTFTNIDAGIITKRVLGTATNQIANDNVDGSGNSTEDLLYGNGELDSIGNITAVAGGGFDPGFPVITNTWTGSGFLPSGSGGVRLKVSINTTDCDAQIGSRFPVTVGDSYNVRGLMNVLSAAGGSHGGLKISWYTSGDAFISSNTVLNVSLFAGGQELTMTPTAPATAAYARVFIFLNSVITGGSFIDAVFDAVYVSKDDVMVRPMPIQLGTIDSPANPVGANRTRTYQIGDKIGGAIEELSNVEAGFDFEVGLAQTTITGGLTILRSLNVKYAVVKIATTIRGIGSDKPSIIFGSYWAGSDNLDSMQETRDASNLATRFNARAAGAVAMAQDLVQIGDIGLWEDSVAISDVGVTGNILLGYAGAEVAYRSMPTRRFNPEPKAYDGTSRVPRIIDDFKVGDIIYSVIDYGAMQIGVDIDNPQPIRLFACTLSISDQGDEKITDIETVAS